MSWRGNIQRSNPLREAFNLTRIVIIFSNTGAGEIFGVLNYVEATRGPLVWSAEGDSGAGCWVIACGWGFVAGGTAGDCGFGCCGHRHCDCYGR